MAIYFVHETARVDIEDVPLDDYVLIERETGTPWFEVAGNPMRHAKAGKMLAESCARIAGVALPDPFKLRDLVKVFSVEPDVESRPTEYDEGIPDPKAQDSGQATT